MTCHVGDFWLVRKANILTKGIKLCLGIASPIFGAGIYFDGAFSAHKNLLDLNSNLVMRRSPPKNLRISPFVVPGSLSARSLTLGNLTIRDSSFGGNICRK